MAISLKHLNAYDLHKRLINDYVLNRPNASKLFQRDTSKDRRDNDIIHQNHRFLWDKNPESWEEQLAKRYFDKLFKEYAICDLSKYKENKIALRWRIEREVVSGKGQFICGNKKCLEGEGLRSWEVNFAYQEHGDNKNALVKLRLCPTCSDYLNYRTKKREVKRLKKQRRKSSEKCKSDRHDNKNTEENSNSNEDETDNSQLENEESEQSEKTESQQSGSTESTENVWQKNVQNDETAREAEIEEYLETLLL